MAKKTKRRGAGEGRFASGRMVAGKHGVRWDGKAASATGSPTSALRRPRWAKSCSPRGLTTHTGCLSLEVTDARGVPR